MPAAPHSLKERAFAILRQPPAGPRIAGWLVILGLIAGSRWWIALHLPAYIWTRDSGSYVAPAVSWLEGQPWVTSPRRGPVYSLFIALIARAGGNFTTVTAVQHVLGALTALLTIAMVRPFRDAAGIGMPDPQ
jgi:hypothetical protein